MNSREIKNKAEIEIEKSFDGLMLFSIFVLVIKTIAKVIPVVGDAMVSPLELSVHDVFSRTSNFKKVSINDFTKYFKTQWHTAFAYTVRSCVYVFLPIVITVVITMIFPLAIIISGIIIIVQLLLCIGKSYSVAIGYYLIYKNPELTSKEALEKSVEVMNGNRWKLFKLKFSLIPQYVQCLLLGYGLPKINRSIQIFFEEIYTENEDINSIKVCKNCGEIRRPGANFCPNCGYDYSKENEQ